MGEDAEAVDRTDEQVHLPGRTSLWRQDISFGEVLYINIYIRGSAWRGNSRLRDDSLHEV